MSSRQSSDSSRSTSGKAISSQSDPDSEAELDTFQDHSTKEPLLSDHFEEIPLTTHKRSRRIWLVYVVPSALLLLTLLGVILFIAVPQRLAPSPPRWNVANFKSVLTFGDSYSDEARFDWYSRHNGTTPPPGTLLGQSYDGGPPEVRKWPRYIVQYGGSSSPTIWEPRIQLYNYAVDGSFCSSTITPRDHPTLLEYAVPAFAADQETTRTNTSIPYFTPLLSPASAVFTIWIGTNDLGMFSFLSDDQVRGKLLSDYTNCVYSAIDGLYAAGARTFVLMNTPPLHLAPSYANESLHGDAIGDLAWQSEKIHELTTSANDIFHYQTPYEFRVSKRYPGAQVALFDVWSLMREVYFNPETYLNGTMEADVERYATYNDETRSSPDSYMWWDRIHPSEQLGRVIAKEFLEVIDGKSGYAQYW